MRGAKGAGGRRMVRTWRPHSGVRPLNSLRGINKNFDTNKPFSLQSPWCATSVAQQIQVLVVVSPADALL